MKTSSHTFWVQITRALVTVAIGTVTLTCFSKVIHPTPSPHYAVLAQTVVMKTTSNFGPTIGKQTNENYVGRVTK